MDSVASGAWYFLSQFPAVTSLLGAFPLTDPITANAGQSWLFSDANTDVLAFVQGSQACAVVLTGFGSWGAALPGAGAQFPRLRVDIWADPLRDAAGNITESSVYTANRGLRVAQAIQHVLQRKDPDVMQWGDMTVAGCHALTFPPQFSQISPAGSGGDWLQRGTAYYGVTCSGWLDVAV
jgi:hypothetical protein